MVVCPFCGNEVEDFDFMCGKCGKTLEPTAGAANLASNYSSGMGDSAGYNPYAGSSAGAGNGYNPYAGSSAGAGNGYNPYAGSSAGVGNSYDSHAGSSVGVGSDYNSYAGSSTGTGSGYNPYAGSSTGTGNGYNPYAGSSTGTGSGYNPYAGSSTGAGNGYNPYAGSSVGAGSGYNPYAGNSTGADNSYNSYGESEVGDENDYNSHDNTYNAGSSLGGTSGGYNPYSSSGGTSGGYNPYSTNSNNSKSSSYNNNAGSLLQDTDSSNVGYEPSKYGAYDSSLDTSKNVDKVRKQKTKNQVSSFFKGVIIVAIIAVAIVIGYPKVMGLSGKPYESLIQEAMVAVEEVDYVKLKEILAIDYEKMLRDIYGSQYEQAVAALRQQNATNVKNMKEKYGNDYKIKTSIASVKNMSGSLKKEAIDKAKDEYERMFKVSNENLNISNYFKEEDIIHIKMLDVKMKISGSKGTDTSEYYVYIAKMDNGRGWKFIEAYEIVD